MIKEFIYRKSNKFITNAPYEKEEFCPRCNASLNFQKGYSNDLNYWVCKGCGEMLINPAIDDEDDGPSDTSLIPLTP